MKLVCTCGIGHMVYEYPVADVEEGGVQMKERHLKCNCGRQLVVRTPVKDEPDWEDPNPQPYPTKTGKNIFSQEAIASALGLNPPKQEIKSQEKTAPSGLIIPGQEASTDRVGSIYLDKAESDILRECVSYYGDKYKPGKELEEERSKFHKLAGRVIEGLFHVEDLVEMRKIRMGLSERALKSLYPVSEYDDESDYNVQRIEAARSLRSRFEKEFEGKE